MRGQCTYLLIDNDPDDCDIFLMALQEIDTSICCEVVNDGVEAVAKFNGDGSFIPSAIFIDLNMTLMNGKLCLRELKKMEQLKEVPMYVYSTSADPRSIEEVIASGANEFIVKPPSFASFVQLLSNLFPG